MSGGVPGPVVWCPCRSDPEPPGPWVYVDDWHADEHHEQLERRRRSDRVGLMRRARSGRLLAYSSFLVLLLAAMFEVALFGDTAEAASYLVASVAVLLCGVGLSMKRRP